MARLTRGLALAALLQASVAHAQSTPTPASMAQQGLGWLAQAGWLAPGEQIGGGENVQRLANDEGMVWHDANTVEMLADYTLAAGDRSYVSVLEAYKTYDPIYIFGSNTPLFGKNHYNDDKLWWALAMLRVYDVTQNPAFLSRAEKVFNDVCASWGKAGACHSSGLAWVNKSGDERPYLNAITNELLFETAAKLALRAPNATSVCGATTGRVTVTSPTGLDSTYPNTYLGWAAAEYKWFADYWFPAANTPPGFDAPPTPVGHLPIPDGLGTDCLPGHSGHGTPWTYNQGVILGALQDLALFEKSGGDPNRLVTDSPDFLVGFAFQIAQSAMSSFSQSVNGKAILSERNELGNASGCQGRDCPEFKGIFMRYLGRLAAGASPTDAGYGAFAPAAVSFLGTNAQAIWTNRAQGGLPQQATPYFPEKWSTPGWESYYQPTQTSALDAIIASIGQTVLASPIAKPAPTPLPSPPGQTPGCSVQPRCGGGLTVGCQSMDMTNGTQPEWPVVLYEMGGNGHYVSLGEVTSSGAPALHATHARSIQLVTCETNVAGSACDAPVTVVPDDTPCPPRAPPPRSGAGSERR